MVRSWSNCWYSASVGRRLLAMDLSCQDMNPEGRLWRLVIVVGVASGLAGAAYVGMLHLIGRALGPGHWTDAQHLIVLGAVGILSFDRHSGSLLFTASFAIWASIEAIA